MKKIILIMMIIIVIYLPVVVAQDALFGSHGFSELMIDFSTMEGGRITNRRVLLYTREVDGLTDVYTRVEAPAFLRNLQFLSLGRKGQESEQWLRTSTGLRRLPSDGSSSESLFNSAVENTDIILQGLVLPNQGQDSIRIPPELAELGRQNKETLEVLLGEDDGRRYYRGDASGMIYGFDALSGQGDVVKTYRVLQTQLVSESLVPLQAVMDDSRSGRVTDLTVVEVRFPESIPGRFFNPQALR